MTLRREPDTRALTATLSRAEVAAFRVEAERSERWRDWSPLAIVVLSIIAAVVGAIPLVSAISLAVEGRPDVEAFVLPALVAVALVGAALLVRRWRWVLWEQRMRRTLFARDNGLRYAEPRDLVWYPGSAFDEGLDRSRDLSFTSVDAPFVEFGTYRWSTGSGKNRRTYRIGFAAVRLERPLPHMVLDARGNNGFFGAGIIPFRFDRDQVLSLEGDFDRYFTLYCPTDYERDALYVFTPDVMALLIDGSSWLDVEIVDDWLFFYATQPFDVGDPVTWRRLFLVHDTVVAKLRRVSGRYRDDRVAGQDVAAAFAGGGARPTAAGGAADGRPATTAARPGGRRYTVAPGGRRLRAGVPWLAIVTTGVIAVLWILAQTLR